MKKGTALYIMLFFASLAAMLISSIHIEHNVIRTVISCFFMATAYINWCLFFLKNLD